MNGWERKTPPGFVLAAKVPQTITHEKILQGCDDDLKHFLETMDLMGDKLGPLLFQFGYFNKTAFKSGKEFLARLAPFLKKLPKGYRFALEIRNKQWLTAKDVSESSIWRPQCSCAGALRVSKAGLVRRGRMPIEIQLITRSNCGDGSKRDFQILPNLVN